MPGRDVARLTHVVVRAAETSGRPVSLVGWSLGGVLSREVARARPDVVRRVITYGTPVLGGPTYTAVARAYSPEIAAAAAAASTRLDAARPIGVPLTVLLSRRDGIVDWRACLDRTSPDVEHLVVRSAHLGLGLDPDVWAVVADRLSRPPRAG